jgi:hypothetical protein
MVVLKFTPSIFEKLEVIQQNDYDFRNQHSSISQKRILWSL